MPLTFAAYSRLTTPLNHCHWSRTANDASRGPHFSSIPALFFFCLSFPSLVGTSLRITLNTNERPLFVLVLSMEISQTRNYDAVKHINKRANSEQRRLSGCLSSFIPISYWNVISSIQFGNLRCSRNDSCADLELL
jgi:hypothetical protein